MSCFHWAKLKSRLSVRRSKSSTSAPCVAPGTDSSTYDERLYLDYYKKSCPLVEEIVGRYVENVVLKEPRMAASLLRLHFHDCFVMGCDASVLLDNRGDIISEKQAESNLNSLRGFEVIDEIKTILEEACPFTVSCADILAIVARDAVESRGGPSWPVGLGRKDSLKASLVGANQYIPTPNSSLDVLILNFAAQGLDTSDLVTLSGSHTIGKSRCLSFKPRIYNENLDKETNYQYKRNTMFRRILHSICPRSGRDNALVSLDLLTPARFDNQYYRNIIQGKGLLQSDNVLLSQDVDGKLRKQVWAYASDQQYYFSSFVASMIKMGNINVLTGEQGEIRRNCRFVNNW